MGEGGRGLRKREENLAKQYNFFSNWLLTRAAAISGGYFPGVSMLSKGFKLVCNLDLEVVPRNIQRYVVSVCSWCI